MDISNQPGKKYKENSNKKNNVCSKPKHKSNREKSGNRECKSREIQREHMVSFVHPNKLVPQTSKQCLRSGKNRTLTPSKS